MNMPKLTLAEVANAIGGKVLRNAAFSNMGFAIHAGPGLLTWLEHGKYLLDIRKNKEITAVIAPEELSDQIPAGIGILAHACPREAFYNLHNHLARNTNFYGKHESTEIHPTAKIEPGSYIAPEGVRIAENVLIESGARVLPGTRIGAGSIIRAGVVLGTHGFQFIKMAGKWVSIDHVGGVEIGEDVEIKEYGIVCRAIFRGDTIIGCNSKLDNNVFIAHNVHVGRCALFCGSSGIAGSTIVGDDVYLGPGANIANCIRVGDGARITMGAVVVSSVPPHAHVTGHWAVPHDQFLIAYGRFLMPESKRKST